MSRSLPYRLECPEKCLQAQDEALNSTFFIIRQTGPTAFVLKEDDERFYKVVSLFFLNRVLMNYVSIGLLVININVIVMHFNAIESYANIFVGSC